MSICKNESMKLPDTASDYLSINVSTVYSDYQLLSRVSGGGLSLHGQSETFKLEVLMTGILTDTLLQFIHTSYV